MPSFMRVFRRDPLSKSKKNVAANHVVEPPKPKWEESWARAEVQPEEVQELIHVCTEEMKSRGMLCCAACVVCVALAVVVVLTIAALDMPFLLLPFRPGLDTIGAKNFVRQYFRVRYEGQVEPKAFARRELMLMEPIVRTSCMHGRR
jgi:Domain of unknown function (DUF1708)